MEISKMSLEQLKSLCYDQIVLLNQTQANINVLQAEIAKKEKENDKSPDA
jgi:hypothetical protein